MTLSKRHRGWCKIVVKKYSFALLLTTLFTMVTSTIFSTPPNSPGRIIVLSGPSCSGKSSVCRELVKILKNSQGVHFDDYFCLGKKNTFLKSEQLVIEEAIRLASQGKIAVCDTVMRKETGKLLHKKAFEKYDTNFVLIYCPFEVLTQRVKNKNQKALANEDFSELRSLEFSQWLFPSYYQPSQNNNKSIGILHRKDVLNLVGFAKKNSFTKTQLRGKELKQEILEKMGLENREHVNLEPAISYDFIVNNGKKRTAQECAQDIKKFIEKKVKTCFTCPIQMES